MNSQFFNAASKIRYLALLMFLTLVSSLAWGAEDDTHDFSQSISQSMNNCATFTAITIAEQSYPIKSVIITYAYNKSTNPTATVTIGTTNVGTQTFTGTGNLTTYKTLTFTPSSAIKGAVTISNTAGSSCSGSSKGTLKVTNVRLVEGASGTTYSVTYYLNGGTGTTPTESNKAKDATFTLHNGTTGVTAPSGKAFSKWKDQDNTEYSGGATYTMPAKNVTLTAQWVDLPKYTITYNAGTGTCATTSWAQGSFGASTTLPTATPPATCTGWSFAGWCTASAGSVEDNTTSPGSILTGSYTPTGNVTLYAVYTKAGAGSGNDEGYYVTTTLTAGKTYIFGAVKAAANASLADNTTFGAVAFTNTYNSTSPNWGAKVDLTPNASGYIAADNASITDACLWTLESITSGNYSFKNGNNYIYLGSLAGSTSNGAQSGVNTSGNMYLENVNSTCKDAFLCHPASNSTNIMLYNTSNGYRMYASRTYSNTMTPYVRFYEYDSGSTTYYMTSLVCCTPLGTINGSVNLTQSGSSITVSGWTYTKGDAAAESNISTYDVYLYSEDDSYAAPVQTQTCAYNSKSVSFTGLTLNKQYKIKIGATGNTNYCPITPVDITTINSHDASTVPFKFTYSIYIDDGTNANYSHNYITASTTNHGTVTINKGVLNSAPGYYQFKVAGFYDSFWGGQSGTSEIPSGTEWTCDNNINNIRLRPNIGGNYVFDIDYSGTPKVTVTFPTATQAANNKIWLDNSILNWSTMWYRVGNTSQNQTSNSFTLVPGTDKFYVVNTLNQSMEAWQLANNCSWSGNNSIYKVDGSGYAITEGTEFQKYVVESAGVTIIPNTPSTGQSDGCDYFAVTKTDGMLKHTATISSYSNGTVTVAYTKYDGTGLTSFTSGSNSDLAHRTILTITATPATGYKLTALTVNGSAFTSGNTHILAADATIAATFTAKTYDVTLDREGATTGSTSVTMTYNSSTHTAITAPTKTGYTFGGWWSGDNGTGSMVMNASGVLQANVSGYTGAGGIWTKDATCTLYAKWTPINYTITYNLNGGTQQVTPAPATSFTVESDAITLPTPTREGYNFMGWYANNDLSTGGVQTTIAAGSTGDKTYWAKWEQKKYTVTWHVGESTTPTTNVTHGTTFSTLEASAPAHADNALSACGSTKFIGWVKASGVYTEDGKTVDWYNTHKFSGSDEITADTHVYAMYAEASGGGTSTITLTNDQIKSGRGSDNNYSSSYNIEGWTGKYAVNLNQSKYALQIGRNTDNSKGAYNSHITTPSLPDGATITSITLTPYADHTTTASGRTFYLLSSDNIGYTAASNQDNDYGKGACASDNAAVTITVTNSPTQCNIWADGTAYLYSISLSYSTATYSNYRTGCTVSCGAPSSLTTTSITKTGATIGWTGGGNGELSKYEYSVWVDGDEEPTSGFTSNGTSTSKALTDLYSGTKYNWKVRKVCTGSDGESRWSYSSFTTTAATLTFSVPTGVAAVSSQASDVDLPEAGVPTSCGSCWAFAGWTASTTYSDADAPADLMLAGTKARVSGDKTLYAVYANERYYQISEVAEVTADEYYIISFDQIGMADVMTPTITDTYYTTSANIHVTTSGSDVFMSNVTASMLWKFTGTTSAGRFYSESGNKYIDLSDYEAAPVAASTTDYVNITKFDSESKQFNIGSNATAANYLQLYEGSMWGVDEEHDGYYSAYLFKRTVMAYATSPDCGTYTVTWDINNGASTSNSTVNACEGYLSAMPTAPADNTLSSCMTNATTRKFVGWSPTKVMPAQDERPSGLFNSVANSPYISDDVTFYAVFANQSSGGEAEIDKTYTFNSGSWGDSEDAWVSGAAGNWNESAVQVTTNKSGANATTVDSYSTVTKVVVTYFTNTSNGAGSIDIQVNGTSYTGGSVTTSGGKTPRTMNFTPPSSALTGKVTIAVTCTTNSIYIQSVQIFYTGSTITYSGYRTACCNDAQFTFGSIADPVTEYVIVREDLESASDAVEIDCNYESANTSGAITWYSTRRAALGFPATGAYTWTTPTSQPTGLNIDVANKKISATATGVWTITLSQASANNYCPADAVVTVRVKTLDKFIDNVNGNFGGDAQAREDVGDGIVLPTEAEFSTNNGCADGKIRRLVGWIKESDLGTYRTSGNTGFIDNLKTADASNKVIAPGTKVQATGCTWYAVWGTEQD